MTLVRADLGARSHDILIEHGLLDRADDLFAPFIRDGRLVVVSDANVWAAQAQRFAGLRVEPIVVAAGEES